MSHRAIQRLREERKTALPDADSDEDDEETTLRRPVAASFAMMYGDNSESSASDEEDGSDADKQTEWPDSKDNTGSIADNSSGGITKSMVGRDDQSLVVEPSCRKSKIGMSKVEDLDTLLEEFKLEDKAPLTQAALEENQNSGKYIIVASMDVRDLDYDYVMRTSLLGSSRPSEGTSRSHRRQAFLFGPPKSDWVRPPHYVGGGIGMATYDDDNHRRPLPWPYTSEVGNVQHAPVQWFTFIFSDSYDRDCEDFQRVKMSGDANAMLMFVAHHPFVTEALLQTSDVLFQTNQRQEAMALLKRVLWIYECSALPSFTKMDGKICFMDFQQPENSFFFVALFRLVKASYVAGYVSATVFLHPNRRHSIRLTLSSTFAVSLELHWLHRGFCFLWTHSETRWGYC
jgi:Transcriptional repressor TCF25